MDVLVACDIADTEGAGAVRLRRVASICEKYGSRVQFSVFECRLSPTRVARMLAELQDAIDAERDAVALYRFPGDIAASAVRIGRPVGRTLGQPWLL
jgi:CRISPR-associated protein Cas2